MREVKHYICERCGSEYNNKAAAEKCEAGHILTVGIYAARYRSITFDGSGYPDRVTIRMKDGKLVYFKRAGVADS